MIDSLFRQTSQLARDDLLTTHHLSVTVTIMSLFLYISRYVKVEYCYSGTYCVRSMFITCIRCFERRHPFCFFYNSVKWWASCM